MGWEPRSDWFSFIDKNGRGSAHPDHFLVFDHAVILFECKLSYTTTAYIQMNGLYRPLLKHIFKKPVVAVQVTRALRGPVTETMIDDPFSVVNTTEEKTYLMQWLG